MLSKNNRKQFLQKLFDEVKNSFQLSIKDFKSIADNSPLKKKLQKIIRKDSIKNSVFICGFASLNDGSYHSVKQDEFNTDADFQNGILASTTMPIIWAPVKQINTTKGTFDQSIDGGIVNVSPLGDVIDQINADDSSDEYTIIIINCSCGEVEREDNTNSNIVWYCIKVIK